MKTAGRIGRAYGYIKTQSQAPRVKQAFANMKAAPEEGIPANLGLAIAISREQPIGSSVFRDDKETQEIFGTADKDETGQLLRISLEMGGKGANMMIVATLPESTNTETASELGQIFNLTYSCTEILGDAEIPVADIYFKDENGIFVSKLSVDVPH